MKAADQWAQIEDGLGVDWTEARLAFVPEGSPAEAAVALAPLQPGQVAGELRFDVSRSGGGPERVRNILWRLDRKRIWGTLKLVDAVEARVAPTGVAEVPEERQLPLVEQWDALVATQPPDWSDLLCELELDSSDHLPRAALNGAPMNPARVPGESALRFRVSGKRGYGVFPGMARRCFERMDAEEITGRMSVVVELSDTENAVTQGPIWRVAGRSV